MAGRVVDDEQPCELAYSTPWPALLPDPGAPGTRVSCSIQANTWSAVRRLVTRIRSPAAGSPHDLRCRTPWRYTVAALLDRAPFRGMNALACTIELSSVNA